MMTLELQVGTTLYLVWLVGSCTLLVWTAAGMVQTHRFLKSCQPVDPRILRLDDEELRLTDRSRSSAAPPPAPQLLTSQSAITPFCWHFHRPCIVLPEYLLAMDRETLRFVVRHELEHLRTGHPVQLFLQRCVEILFWFHPLVWWASRQVSVSREVACDAAAVRNSPRDIARYLRALLAIVERSAMPRNWALRPVAFLSPRSVIATRTMRLVAMAAATPGKQPVRLPGSAARAGLIALSLLAMAVWFPLSGFGSFTPAWSPWPQWTAAVLHDFGIHARDFETHASYGELQEWINGEADDDGLRPG
jgi:beta-lactamase regulating signal transducer with metallopeptidase domain